MAYVEINSTATESIADLMVYTGGIFPGFWPLVLVGFWLILALGAYFSQQRLGAGSGDFISSAAVASFATLVVTFILSLIPGLISLYVMGIVLMVTIITAWMLLSSENKL